MKGLTWDSLKKNYSLIPLFLTVGLGVAGATLYPIRMAIKSPDVTWNSKKNPEPWNDYRNKQYKFYATEKMAGKTESPAPVY